MKKPLVSLILIFFCCLLFVPEIHAQPNLNWVKSIEGTMSAERFNVKQTPSGNVLLVGTFNGTIDLDPDTGVVSKTSFGSNDIAMAMYDSLGNFLWGHQFGSSNAESAYAFEVDDTGNIYMGANIRGNTDFDPDSGTAIFYSSTYFEAVIVKFSPNGQYLWGKQINGSVGSNVNQIELDEQNNLHIMGRFNGNIDFIADTGMISLSSSGNVDSYFAKLDPLGNTIWAHKIGGFNNDFINSLALANDGSIYLAGSFNSSCDFDPGPNTYNLNSSGKNDIFLAKYNSSGNLLWAYKAGSSENDNGSSVGVDPDGNVVLFAAFNHTVDFRFGSGAFNLTSQGISDIAVAKYTSSGNLMWVKQFGNADYDWVTGSDIAPDGAIYFIGYFSDSLDLNPSSAVNLAISKGQYDGYINKLDENGNYVWGKRFGGTSYDYCFFINVESRNDVFVSGTYNLTADFDFDPMDTLVSIAGYDAYFLHIKNCGIDSSIHVSACGAISYGNKTYTKSGTYYQTTFDSLGCDSTIVINAQIDSLPLNTVSRNGFTLRANDSTQSYQWLDCQNAYAPIQGDTNQTFLAIQNGSYAVELTNSLGCIDTSSCINIINVGIDSQTELLGSIEIYPNPTKGSLFINWDDNYNDYTFRLFSIYGQLIQSKIIANSNLKELRFEGSTGIYLLEVTNKLGQQRTIKIVKE